MTILCLLDLHKLNRKDVHVLDPPHRNFFSYKSKHSTFLVIKANIPLLKNDDRMKTILGNHSIIKSHRQPKNLKEILTKAKFEDQSNNVSAKISITLL